jgi:hypothetical protein
MTNENRLPLLPNANSEPVAGLSPTAGSSSYLDPSKQTSNGEAVNWFMDYRPPDPQWAVAPISQAETIFRHSGWLRQRRKTFHVLKAMRPDSNRLDRFANCGSELHVQYSESREQFRLVGNFCHDRFCLPCCSARSRKIAAILAEFVKDRRIRFITLTLRHSRTTLKDQVDRLLRSFKELRRRGFWKGSTVGGAYFLEVKYKPGTCTWHPHLHVLVEGAWVDQKTLSQEWLSVTGDSFIVDVRAVKSREELVNYVCKYASKPLDPSLFEDGAPLSEAIDALAGRRLCSTFGTWRGLVLEPEDDGPDDWIPVGSYRQLCDDARSGDEDALNLLRKLAPERTVERNSKPPPKDIGRPHTPPPAHDLFT